jgi:hypothetical protein
MNTTQSREPNAASCQELFDEHRQYESNRSSHHQRTESAGRGSSLRRASTASPITPTTHASRASRCQNGMPATSRE